MVADLVFHFIMHRDSESELPISIEVIADDRTIPVAGHDLRFSGVQLNGDMRWAGEVEHESTVIKVVTSADMPMFSIEPCRDWSSLSEIPPEGT
jgi:hypothetical protein